MSDYQKADAVILAFLRGEPQPRTRAWLRPTQGFECLELRYSVRDPSSGITGPCYVIVAELREGRVRVLAPGFFPQEVSPRRARAIYGRIVSGATILGLEFTTVCAPLENDAD